MNQLFFRFLLFLFQIILIYFISRKTISEMFYFLRRVFKDDRFVFSLISLIFLPGTAIHELSHFFAATILMLRVVEVKIFPEFKNNEIKLGKVLYQKPDFIRSILIGLSPFFAGLLFFFFLSTMKFFPQQNIWLNLIFAYLIFTISSTMFSSKEDLVDLIYIFPLLIIIVGIIYIFNLPIDLILKNKSVIEGLDLFFKSINFYLFFSIIINISIILILKILKKLF